VSVLVDRELEQLTRLEAALHAERQRAQEIDAGAFQDRLADAHNAESQLLGRVRKTLVTARSLPAAEGRQRVEKVMPEARTVRSMNEALSKDIEAGLARTGAAPEKLAPEAEKKSAE
jgi:hypothetical protein